MKKVLVPVFQPIVDIHTREIAYFEALARQANGNTDHGEIIGLGERYGFIYMVDLGILAQVIRVLEQWPCVNISVNVSVVTLELALPDLLSLVFAHMDLAHRLVFEITETVQIRDFDRVMKFVQAIRLAGARIAVDDFGDGFATMPVVERIRPDFVKFPASMMEMLSQSGEVETMIKLRTQIESMGGSVIVEYVDSAEKRDILKKAGVRYGQGHFFGRVRGHPSCDRIDCPPGYHECRHVSAPLMAMASVKCG